ncbi:MAG TPA: hypothetical protein PKA10_18080 [Selenomonadales bacterium]|nr:hypothetical protein [Selenomonadales bacterium]
MMTEIHSLKAQLESFVVQLERVTATREAVCEQLTAGGITAEPGPAAAELEVIQRTTEMLRRDLESIRHRGPLDPEVRDLEIRLEEALNKYFYLWHKCRDSVAPQEQEQSL